MTDRELEQRLAQAVSRAAPDDLDAILSRCGEQNGSVMEMKQQNIVDLTAAGTLGKKKGRAWLAAACAALVLLGAGGAGGYYYQNCAVASVVSLDVNPSIELKASRGGRVISCTALNQDAAAVLFSMDGGADLKGAKLDVAVNAIVGALVKAGYMDSISSAILISVEDSDQARAARLQQELVASVDGVLQSQAPGTSVFSQVIACDAGAAAPEYAAFNSGISAGKAALVRRVMEMNGTISTNSTAAFDQLAALSVEELEDLLKTGETRIPIGKSAAAMAAEEYAGTLEISSVTADVDPELDENPPHYEVELKTAWGEFEYIVDAFGGGVLSGQQNLPALAPAGNGPGAEQPPQTSGAGTAEVPAATVPQPAVQPTPQPDAQDVGREAALRAALDHAGLSESQIASLKVERDWDDGRLEYDVEFWCGETEYDYTIDGYSCSVVKHEQEHHAGSHHSGASSSADIGGEAAKAAALAHAGVLESETAKMKVERDWDDGRLEYEVEFEAGRAEYKYTIDGATGAVLEYEQDWD